MILNPFKLDDASEVYEKGEELGLTKEEMLKALYIAHLSKKHEIDLDELQSYLDPLAVAKELHLDKEALMKAVIIYGKYDRRLLQTLFEIPLDKVYSVLIAPRKRKVIVTHPHPLPDLGPATPVRHTSGKFILSYQTHLRY